ncbi:MAG: hypothetical protein K1X66_03445 [Verrucomicrobiae bacterium]|nr:hypothetical protein [Verrucomicrobiae bacterium]
MLYGVLRKLRRLWRGVDHLNDALEAARHSFKTIDKLNNEAKELQSLAKAVGKTQELIEKTSHLKTLSQDALAKTKSAYDKAYDAATALGGTADATIAFDHATRVYQEAKKATEAVAELEKTLSNFELRNPNNVEKAIEKVIATTEAANKAAALAATTGTALLLALPEHPLNATGKTLGNTLDGILETVETIECLNGYNPLCSVEDAVIDRTIQSGTALGDKAGTRLDQAFREVEKFGEQTTHHIVDPRAWGIGPY